ncbi:unnamed protein product [Chironomus riparius]|uniref:Uncharacterized protein n=1 Tax=Chironomus riparius TaxID=315576 RepID=A0A9N9RX78_9DIPT|nr:unnamed protein product [Chironomus riparius]
MMLKLIHVAIFIIFCDKIFSLPYDVEKCKIDDESCLLTSSNKVLQKYYGGIPEIDLASLDPFLVNQFFVDRKYSTIKIKNGDFSNMKMRGLQSATIEKISGFDKDHLEIEFKAPKLTFTGSFKADAKVLFFPINTDGEFTLKLYDYDAKLNIKLDRYTRNRTKYFQTTGYCIHSTVRTGDIDSTGVPKIVNWLINLHFNSLFKSSIQSFVDDIWSAYYEKAINVMLTKVPIGELFTCEMDRDGH